ncbi:MAG TPA: DUF192 domain-containing protein [Kiritimatiellia bacterium]|nr:DUF192 domain-containing protein [Kiritimatiellia bacterium]
MSGSATGRVRTERGDVLIERLHIAATPWRRLRGLLGRTELAAGEGLLIRPCGGIHTTGMRFAIDVIFLDRAGTVLRVVRDLRPCRICPGPRGTCAVLEVQSGWLPPTAIPEGIRLVVEER